MLKLIALISFATFAFAASANAVVPAAACCKDCACCTKYSECCKDKCADCCKDGKCTKESCSHCKK